MTATVELAKPRVRRPKAGHVPDLTLLHGLFEQIAISRPKHPAVIFDGKMITYAQLDRRANQIARYLRSKRVAPGDLVVLYMHKSVDLFAALLGILKCGAGYVPIDPKFPIDRVLSIIESSLASFVLTQGHLAELLDGQSIAPVLRVDKDRQLFSGMRSDPLSGRDTGIHSTDLCYVIFTSGSTGKPKGVMVEHRNAVNFVKALSTVYRLGQDDLIYHGFSIAFDAAVEEVWAAFSLGGTLVVAPDDVARSPLDAAQFINDHGITFFSTVPTFLSTIGVELPSVRLLVVGGEACPSELVQRWSIGRRMLNTYGPTEATVVATYAEVHPGAPVTIGTALPGYSTYVLDDQLQPVPAGGVGELYIGGAGVTRGYLGQRALTEDRFIKSPFANSDPKSPVLYRTHDHVRLTDGGALAFLGRVDGQVKIRGFRIELSEIESVLLEHRSIRAAAVGVTEHDGLKEIFACVVEAALSSLQRDEVAALLRSRLPDYMVPKYLDEVDALPMMTSGKVDRNQLPAPMKLLGGSDRALVLPETRTERLVLGLWEKAVGQTPISVTDDFFRDLGGHSLLASRVINELRTALGTNQVCFRDLYQKRTIRELSRHIDAESSPFNPQLENAGEAVAHSLVEAVSPPTRWFFAFLQAVSILIYYGIATAPVACVIIVALRVHAGALDFNQAMSLLTIGGFLYWPATLCLTIALKWLVIGRYRAGRYPLWGSYYFRWWLVSRFQSLGWPELFVGSPLMTLYYRAMGANIGRNCTIATNLCTAYDLIKIGDRSSIGAETQLLGYRVEAEMLVLAPVEIGKDCFVGMHSCLGLDTAMMDGSRLDDMSLLYDGATIEAGGARKGSPAVPAVVEVKDARDRGNRRRPLLFGLLHLGLIYAIGYVHILSLLPSVAVILIAFFYWGAGWAIAATFAAVPIGLIWYMAVIVGVKRLVLGRSKPGLHPVESLAYLRHWTLDILLNTMRVVLLPLYATLYMPPLLRFLGAKIGRHVEFSTVMYLDPDLLEVGEGSFCADACLVGGSRIHAGNIDLQPTKIGARSFIGNSALVPGGTQIGEGCLIGVLSTPPAGISSVPDDTRWLGSPGFELPKPAACHQQFTAEQTYSPTKRLYCLRLGIELLRILLPFMLTSVGLVIIAAILAAADAALPFWMVTFCVPVAAGAAALTGIVASSIIKKVLIGTFTTTVQPLWSSFVWLNEVVNAVYEGVAATAMLPMMGTPFIAPCLRLMGCKIGRSVFLETTLFSEFDLVEIGDGAAINLGGTIQTHLFEDRILKTGTLKVGADCTVGNMSVILYDTEMERGSWLGPLSVLMKGETLPPLSRWHGIPTQRA